MISRHVDQTGVSHPRPPPLPLSAMQAEPIQPLPVNEKRGSWWATEADRVAWIEFVEANKVRNKPSVKGPWPADEPSQTLNFDYMTENEPFDNLPWQFFPKPKIGHHPPLLIYGFSLGDGVSGIEHLGYATGVLKPEEALTTRNFDAILMQAMRHLEEECGLSRKELHSVNHCYSKTDTSYVLKLKTNYKPEHIPSKRLEHVIRVLGKYFPGKRPQWFLDPDILDTQCQSFEISGSLLRSLCGIG